jgi:hypothetical protein
VARFLALGVAVILLVVVCVLGFATQESHARYRKIRACLKVLQKNGFHLSDGAFPPSFSSALWSEYSNGRSAFPSMELEEGDCLVECIPQAGLVYPYQALTNTHRSWGDLQLRYSGRTSRFLQHDFVGGNQGNHFFQENVSSFLFGYFLLPNGYPIERNFNETVASRIFDLPTPEHPLPSQSGFSFRRFPTEFESVLVLEQRVANPKTLLAQLRGMIPVYLALTTPSSKEALARQKEEQVATTKAYQKQHPPSRSPPSRQAPAPPPPDPLQAPLIMEQRESPGSYNKNEGMRTCEVGGAIPLRIQGTLQTDRMVDVDCYGLEFSSAGSYRVLGLDKNREDFLNLSVSNSSGRPLSSARAADAPLRFQVPRPGRYFLLVTKLDAESLAQGIPYSLYVGP